MTVTGGTKRLGAVLYVGMALAACSSGKGEDTSVPTTSEVVTTGVPSVTTAPPTATVPTTQSQTATAPTTQPPVTTAPARPPSAGSSPPTTGGPVITF